MGILKGAALAAVLTSAGVGASQRRDHLQLQGPVTNCYLGPAIKCTQNATHILFSSQDKQTMMVKGPNGIYTVEAEHGHPLGNQPTPPPPPVAPAQPGTQPPPEVPAPSQSGTPPRARPETPVPARPGTSYSSSTCKRNSFADR